ncbi:hypothetical protein [Spirosoma sp.]|uniref:hypothetical protein n=1 Tax=Spirosoma sp. TaxID=1899569 RepID=UPI003B3A4AB3
MKTVKRYIYLGDRMTDPTLKGQLCSAVLRDDGKCIRGRNGNMLVTFDDGRTAVVISRLLRKLITATKIAFVQTGSDRNLGAG